MYFEEYRGIYYAELYHFDIFKTYIYNRNGILRREEENDNSCRINFKFGLDDFSKINLNCSNDKFVSVRKILFFISRETNNKINISNKS